MSDGCLARRNGPYLKPLEQMVGDMSDIVHGAVERSLVRRRRVMVAADLADKLERGVVELLIGWSLIWAA